VAAFPASWLASKILAWCILVPLLVFRRVRHLVVYIVALAVTSQLALVLSAVLKRPRAFGVVIDGTWNGYALPSVSVAILAASLVSALYVLVPEGRWRQVGKWAATAIVALAGLARVALGLDAPTDVLLGAVIGVTIPLLAFRWFTPNEVFPVSYRRGSSAHLDVGGASWRATAVGVYRLWRDTGFAVGALLAGLIADLAGLDAAVWVVAALTAASGLVVAVRMYETHRPIAQS
jgi:hypothetical protein